MGKASSNALRGGGRARSAENRIAKDKDFENFAVFDGENRLIRGLKGGQGSVDLKNLTPEERERAKGGIAVHNHPSGVAFNLTSFSRTDLVTAYELKLAEIRVAAGTFRASFKWSDTATKADVQGLGAVLDRLSAEHQARISNRGILESLSADRRQALSRRNREGIQRFFNKTRISRSQEYARLINATLTQNARKYNYTFTHRNI
ncbi:MAG: JAB domain-containing protein [Turicibacter sp.]|nr:JAB domain-containing protein [Turicibacter sp.]